MGCICSKGARADEFVEETNSKGKGTVHSSKRFVSSFRRDECVAGLDDNGNDATSRLISNQPVVDILGPTPVVSNEEETKRILPFPDHNVMSKVMSMVNGERGAQVVAGWPSWLTAVAGEAINGWVPRGADSFEKLDKIGQGTYSSVYKARDLETNKIVALKKVRFANMDPESVQFMAREIIILRKLDHPNVMKLEGIITSRVSGSLYLVFEYMEHDLAGLLASPGVTFTEAQIKCYMQQLLKGLAYCHSRGVLHRDIKGSNLLVDYRGILKIGDFGLATFFNPQKQPLTSRVVTLWYRPPELLLGATYYGVSVDLWSTGCILAELFAGKPIMPGRTEVEQLHKIFKLCGSPSEEYWKTSKLPHATIFKPQQPYKRCVSETFKDFPSSALALLDILLAVEPQNRGTASSALDSDFFTTKPLPCDPSCLPKYPPSKEFDAKLRDEHARRQKAAAGKGLQNEPAKRNSKETRSLAAPDANAELLASIQKRKGQGNPISVSEKFNPEEDGGSGFPIEPRKAATARNGYSHSGQSMHPTKHGSSREMNPSVDAAFRDTSSMVESSTKGADLKTQRSYIHRGVAQLSRFSNSVAVRGSSQLDCSGSGSSINGNWPVDRLGARYNNPDDSSHHLLARQNLPCKEDQHPGLDHKTGLFAKKGRMHYSGPLMPAGGNIDNMLKEHERQIQQAVRKARSGKSKANQATYQNRQTESLLYSLR